MIRNKMCKFLISLITVMVMITIIGQSLVFAADSVRAVLSKTRYVKVNGELVPQGAYALNDGTSHPLFQILSVDGSDHPIGANFYCLNASKGATWMSNVVGTDITFDKSYDLVTQKDEISNSTSLVTTYKNVVSTNYGKVMWVLDNMYKEGGITINQLLANAGIIKGDTGYTIAGEPVNSYYYEPTVRPNSKMSTDLYTDTRFYGNATSHGGYWYTDNGEIVDVVLTQDMVEAIQQAVIWYFTNNAEYDFYTTSYDNINWLKYATDINANTIDWPTLSNKTVTNSSSNTIKTGEMLQEQAAILYNYLVEGANEAGNDYVGTSVGTIQISFTGASTDSKITEIGNDYVIGPLKITTTGSTTLKNNAIEVKVGANTITGQVTDASGSAKTLNVNENFYVKVAKSDATGTITIKANAEYTATNKTMWIKEVTQDADAEQPIVEIEGRKEDIDDSIDIPLNKQFDLALRKTIVKVADSNGTTKSMLNESGLDATRNVTVTTSTIPDTATYKHRKDPIVISTGDVVTYRITIYNEGEIDGYASKIVDQLPTGLESVLKLNGTVTSHEGNVYKVTEYDTTTNKLVLSIDTTQTIKSIDAFNGTTLKNDYIEIDCEVKGTAANDGTTKKYLTNIAYISEGYDSENNTAVTADRDGNESKTTQSPNQSANDLNNSNADNYKGNSSNNSVYHDTNNDEYYKGQEDDDDFEKVVLLPKEFDLKLMKFISKINDTATTRNITINTTNLNKVVNGKKVTTADYDVSKVPLTVKVGDYVTYTFRVYNEGEVDGYASEITEDIPTGLEYDASKNTEGVWTLSGDGRTLTTDFLSRTKNAADNLIVAFDSENDNGQGSGLSSKEVSVTLKVTSAAQDIIRNEAEISEDEDRDGNPIDDRDSDTEDWKKEDSDDNYENDPNYPKYKEDDEDYDNIKLVEFDLALRKYISKVSTDGNFEDTNTTTSYNRAPQVNTSELKAGTADTAIYNHSKEPILLNAGDFVLYTIRAYNEGDIDGYASQITDYLPENLDFVESTDTYIKAINDNWTYDSTTRKVTTTTNTKLNAFDAQNDNGNGSGLSYVDVQIVCKVNKNTPANRKLTNIAEITEYKDEDGNVVQEDRDSESDNLDYPEDSSTYKDNEINNDYVPGQEDDDDFEKVIIKERKVDLALTKFITAVSVDDKIENGEYLTPDKNIGSKTNEYIRATVADTTGLKAGTSTNATYTAKKDIDPLTVSKNSYILYNIRVYNEGEVDAYAGKIADYLPENLEFVNGEFNEQYGWTANGQTIETTYLSYANGEDKMLKAFDKENDDGQGSGLDYKDLPVLCKVSDKAESGKKMVNTAEITKYEDENGNEIPKDIDSTPENKEEKNVEDRDEDDDDYEVIIIKDFDLALRKFITEIDTLKTQADENANPTTGYGREPNLSYENGKITYTHPKDVLRINVGDIVIYTLRVYNEGDIAGFAEEITDDIPEYLEFLPEDATNREYKWVMYDEEGKSTTKVEEAVKIKTDYTSKANGEIMMRNDTSITENPNLLKAFDKTAGITDSNPDYLDVKVAFRVKDPNSNETVIVNKAQISEDADENGNPVEDIDSVPDKWNEGEDDQDYENVAVDYFDLSLLKYVTKAIVTENGKTKTTKTGNNGSDKDITPKVEVYRKSLNKTIVKFEFTIKITNEGDIAGYAREITDYVPKGLKFYKEDNKGWKDEGNNVISTKLLKDTLLQPGESATVKVILRWINGENNLGLKTNVAEISEDYNEKGVPDRDSTPDNKKKGEDDIDDAPVLLTISTGMLEHTIQYATIALVILVVLGSGLVVIKKYVL